MKRSDCCRWPMNLGKPPVREHLSSHCVAGRSPSRRTSTRLMQRLRRFWYGFYSVCEKLPKDTRKRVSYTDEEQSRSRGEIRQRRFRGYFCSACRHTHTHKKSINKDKSVKSREAACCYEELKVYRVHTTAPK